MSKQPETKFYNKGIEQENLGYLYLNNAITSFTKAIKIKQDFGNAYYHRGIAFLKREKLLNAFEDFTNAITYKTEYMDSSYLNRGHINLLFKNFKEAIKDYTETIKLDKRNVDAYFNRGNAHNLMKDYKSAIEDYTKAIRLAPFNAQIYYNRGKCYALLGHKYKAIEDYTIAIEIKSDFMEALREKYNLESKIPGKEQEAYKDYLKLQNFQNSKKR